MAITTSSIHSPSIDREEGLPMLTSNDHLEPMTQDHSWKMSSQLSPQQTMEGQQSQPVQQRFIPNAALIITEEELNSSYTYALARGNGTFTPLIPADLLPDIDGLDIITRDATKMIVLPQPRMKQLGRSAVCICPPVASTTHWLVVV